MYTHYFVVTENLNSFIILHVVPEFLNLKASEILTEVTLHARTLVLLKLGNSITEKCYDQLL